MKVSLIERSGKFFLEGFADHGLLRDVADTTLLIEACFNHKTNSVLLYAENLTDHFFDISSQKQALFYKKCATMVFALQ